MQPNTTTTLLRDCDALLIPSGTPIYLAKGTEVMITQALGGAYTVAIQGNLARISEEDSDAIDASTLPETSEKIDLPEGDAEHRIWAMMKTVYDPEIPVNVVDLGLIYDVAITPLPDHETLLNVKVTMTLTAPGCGMGPVIVDDVKRKILLLDDVEHVDIELVFDPPWSQDKMSMEAKLQLNML